MPTQRVFESSLQTTFSHFNLPEIDCRMRNRLLRLASLAFAASSLHGAEPDTSVLVYGATPGGFCAAIAAAREGAAVTLLEPSAHVGGVNTGGLCFSDSNQTVRSTVRGLFEEWHLRVEADYESRGVTLPYRVAEKNHSPWTYEPHVAARVTKEMLAEAGVKVLTNHPLQSVLKDGTRLAKLVTTAGAFEAGVFVDATYEGDLMAAAGIAWTIGRESRSQFEEPLAGKQYPKAKIRISGLHADGMPLPLITTTNPGPDAQGDSNVMVYSFRLCVTKDPENRVPFPKPKMYDPARFEAVRRYLASEKRPILPWDLYPLPGKKFDANNGIGKQFSMGFVGACNGWSEADQNGRAAIWEAHKQYTLEFYHFLTTDESVPKNIQKEMSELGLCRDEFLEYDHWSPQLYVREGRRMIGAYVLSQKDILRETHKSDAIVVSSFPVDSHDCQRVGKAEYVVDEGTIMPLRMPGRRHGYPYQVPYRSITPNAAECSNLLVPVALSCTHVGFSSIRVEPTWMILGQSAGIAAALSAKQGIAVQELPYPILREHLLARGQVLELPSLPATEHASKGATEVNRMELPTHTGIVLDDTQAELQGSWIRSTKFAPHVGTGYFHDDKRGDGQSAAVFRVRVPNTGRYTIGMAYSPHETRATRVPVTIQNGTLSVELLADQTQPLEPGKPFRHIGSAYLQKETETTITIRNASTKGFVILDAFQLLPEP